MNFSEIDKDSFCLVLWHLLPRDALAVRATCCRFNLLVSKAQVYWFQYVPSRSRRGRTDEQIVHIKPYDITCLGSFGYQKLYRLLQEQFPELPFPHIPHNQPYYHNNQPYDHNNTIFRRFCLEHKHLWSSVQGFRCFHRNHIGVARASDIGTPKILTQQQQTEAAETEGLFIFHYLFDCYAKGKKRITKYKKWPRQRREHIIESHHNKIKSLKLEIAKMKAEIAYLEKFDQLNSDVRTCPFQRKTPETYKPDYLLREW